MSFCTVKCSVAQYHDSIVQHCQRLYNTVWCLLPTRLDNCRRREGGGGGGGGEKVGNSTADNIRPFKWSFCRISLLTMYCLVRSSMWQDSEALQQSHSTCSSDDCLGPAAECGGGRAG